jgi:glycosyltransferase involved in cell wall biosynthesis
MRVLVVTNMFPSPSHPSDGLFIRREMDAIMAVEPAVRFEVAHFDTVRDKALYVSGASSLRETIDRFDPDLVHVHYGLTGLIARDVRRPMVLTLHGSDVNRWWQRPVSRWASRHADEVVCVAGSLRDRLGRPAVVIPAGVDSRVYRPGDRHSARAALGVGGSDLALLFPSSPSRAVKDPELFRRVVEELAGEFGSRGIRALYLDGVAPEEVPLYMQAADAVLLTSHTEGSPVATKEALCCGTRVVSVNVGDVADQLSGFSGARVVDGRQSAALAGAVQQVLAEDAPDAQVAARRFDIAGEARAVLAVYGRVLGGSA